MSDHEHLMNPDPLRDSAGVPWQGRHFEANSWADDDGSADAKLIETIQALAEGKATSAEVLDALRGTRVLVPLLANLGEFEIGAHGHAVDKSAELSIVTVETPDGQSGLPVFTSVTAMSNWNKAARPVPVGVEKAALAAAAEGNTRLIIDAANPTEYVVRRPAIAALAQSLPWVHPTELPEVLQGFQAAVPVGEEIIRFEVQNGDPRNLLDSAEVELVLVLKEGLDRAQIDELMQKLAKNLSESYAIAEFVDSLRVKLASA